MVVSIVSQLRTWLNAIPTRLNIAVMLFFACFFSYMLRVNMSINMLAMVKHYDENGQLIDEPDFGPRYDWTAFEQSLLLGAYFWGYAITSIPTGILCEKYGGKTVVTYIFAICVLLTALVPVLAPFPVWIMCVIRFLIGFVSGGLYPALHKLMSKWAPPGEKGKFTSALVGGAIGTVTTWPLAGWLIETIGWQWAFYVPAALTAIMTAVWFAVTFDSPAVHPRIRPTERTYIEQALTGITATKTWPPLWRICTSVPFWSLFFLHYGNLWGLYFLLTGAPKFMNEVLKFNLSKAGILASLPYLARFFAGILFGAVGDYMQRNRVWAPTTIRKVFCVFSHVIPGLFLVSLPYVSDQPYVCVAFITLSLGFNGASTTTNLQNSHDLAPNYAATVYGIINTAGTTAGFITPLVVAYFTRDRNTVDEWNMIFVIGAIAYIAPALLFMVFGSGAIQSWNEIPTGEKAATDAEAVVGASSSSVDDEHQLHKAYAGAETTVVISKAHNQ